MCKPAAHEQMAFINPDGSKGVLYVPRTPRDVEEQPNIPAAALATVAFAPLVNGRRAWSQYTYSVLKRQAAVYGEEVLRRHLCALLTEILGGFKPDNPIGLLIHRVRQTPTDSTPML